MKHIKLLLITLIFTINGYGQIKYHDSFINENLAASLHLFGTEDIYISQNGKFIYAFSNYQIIKYNIDPTTGKAISAKAYDDMLGDPNSTSGTAKIITFSEDDKFLFIADKSKNKISVFEIDQSNGDCLYVETIQDSGEASINSPSSLSVSKDNKYLYVMSSADNQITIFKISDTGNLLYSSRNISESLSDVLRIDITPDNKYIYGTSAFGNKILIFSVNQTDGSLNYYKQLERDDKTEILIDGIRDIAFDEKGYVYMITSNDGTLVTFKSNTDYGNLNHYKTFTNGSNDVTGLDKPISITIDPNLGDIYICSAYSNRYITRYYWTKTGHLVYSKQYSQNVYDYNISDIKISLDSKFLYGGQMSGSICSVFELGAFLNLGEDIDACKGDSILISPDIIYSDYQWLKGSKDTSMLVTETSEIYLNVTDYYGRNGTDTISITFHNPPEINLGNDTTIYYNDTLTIELDNIFNSYLWSTGDTINKTNIVADLLKKDTLIYVNVTNEYSCSTNDTIHIQFTYPEINLGRDTTINYNDTLILTINNIYESYLWSDGSITNSISIVGDSTRSDSVIYVDVKGVFNWSSSDTILIHFTDPDVGISNTIVNPFNIYPNPFTNRITIENIDNINIKSIRLIDISGKIVFIDPKQKGQNVEYDLNKLKEGIYFLSIQIDNQFIKYKIVKKGM